LSAPKTPSWIKGEKGRGEGREVGGREVEVGKEKGWAEGGAYNAPQTP